MRLREGLAGLPAVVRAVDGDGVRLANLQLHAPTLDDVFLAKTGRSLEGAGGEPETAPSRLMSGVATQVATLAHRSVVRTLRQAWLIPPIIFPLALMAVNAGGLESATNLPGFPTDRFSRSRSRCRSSRVRCSRP